MEDPRDSILSQGTMTDINLQEESDDKPINKEAKSGWSWSRSRSSRRGSGNTTTAEADLAHQDPFGDETRVDEHDIHYKSLKWWQCAAIMIAETVSIGTLGLPSVLAKIGLVPGVILLVGLGAFASYSAFVIGQFKKVYPWVYSMADAFEILFKPLGMPRVGREIGGSAQTLLLIFAMAGHIITWVICLDTLTDHATCRIVWAVVGLVFFWLLDLPRTLKNVAHLSIAAFSSIIAAVIVVMIALGVQQPGRGPTEYTLWPREGLLFRDAFSAVTNIVFAYAGHVTFFGFISELKDPNDYPKALAAVQLFDITFYTVSAVVIYRYGGQNVQSPALSSASPLVAKVAWGVAIPTIVIASVIYGHMSSKYVYIRIFKGTEHIHKRTLKGTLAWIGITAAFWIAAFVIGESIPNFDDLLGIVAALLASWFTYSLTAVFWLFMNKGKWFSTWRKTVLFFVNVITFVIGATVCGVGLYTSGDSIHRSKNGHSWDC